MPGHRRRHRHAPTAVLLAVLLLVAFPSWCRALPLHDIQVETVSRFMRGGLTNQFAWFSRYDIGFDSSLRTFGIDLRVRLVGADPGPALRTTWERGIEETWSNRFWITMDRAASYATAFDVEFVSTGHHHTVTVHGGTGRVDMLNWYTLNPSGWPQDRQGLTAAHEAGHMFGNFDEYPGGGVNPDGSFGNVPDSLMGGLLTPTLHDRHFQFAVDWVSGKAPGHTFVASPTPVPEPGTLLLVGTTAGLGWWRWRKRRAAPPAA